MDRPVGDKALRDLSLCRRPISTYISMCLPQNKWLSIVGSFDFQMSNSNLLCVLNVERPHGFILTLLFIEERKFA